MGTSRIRNFCILAHIDHGKSTLADRFLELTGAVEKRKMRAQFLDMHPLEREKGITIKMQPVRMAYTLNAIPYTLNLIDTPGHVDFTYEVSRALAAVEGALLLVDATQGVQAQTIANLHLALEQGLVIIPVINKIDLPSAEIEKAEQELVELLGIAPNEILKISAKTGAGVEGLLRAVIERVPPPSKPKLSLVQNTPLRALIFDSVYDPYQGIIAHVRIVDGKIATRERVRFLASGTSTEISEVGTFAPQRVPCTELHEGEIGYLATGIKGLDQVRVGDTITKCKSQNAKVKSDAEPEEKVLPLPGYREPMPMVFASVFPENQDEYEQLRDALQKLKLNDAALVFEPETGLASLGRGFRVGFLGMLHMEIISERLSREYELSLVFSNPSVAFRVYPLSRSGGSEFDECLMVYSAMRMPDRHEIRRVEEPWVQGEIVAPSRFLGALTTLVHERAGMISDTLPLAGERNLVKFEAPLREIIVDFHDVLKSISQGFASFSYVLGAYRPADLVRLDILVAGEKIPAFSEIVPAERGYAIGRARVQKLKELLPRELFAVALQAVMEGRVLARETIPAMRKDVTGYLYGGDRTRKMKLWKKQQRGKKRLMAQAVVEIPSDVFLKMMKR